MGKCAWCDAQFRVVDRMATGGYVRLNGEDPTNPTPVAPIPNRFADPVILGNLKNKPSLNFEQRINAALGFPQQQAISITNDTGDQEWADAVRHANSGRITAQNLQNMMSDYYIPNFVSAPLAFLGSNALGIGHELGTIYKDKRPLEVKLREAGEDIYNNSYGAKLGALNDPEGRWKIEDAWINNRLPDGMAFANKNDNGYMMSNGNKGSYKNVDEQRQIQVANKNRTGQQTIFGKLPQMQRDNTVIRTLPRKMADGGDASVDPGKGVKKPLYSWTSPTAPPVQLKNPLAAAQDYMSSEQLALQKEKQDAERNRQLGNMLESVAPTIRELVPNVSKEWLFNNIRPWEYPTIEGGIQAIIKGIKGQGDVPQKDESGSYDVADEAWAKALGLNIPQKYIIPSEYKPTKAKDTNAAYYKLSPDIIDPTLIIDEAKNLGLKEGDKVEFNSLAPFVNENFMDPESFSGIDPLQGFQMSIGRDNKGKYVAIYDKYDFEGPLNSIIKPYEFYDRFYFPEKKGNKVVPKKAYGGEILFPDMFEALADPKNLHLHDGIYAPASGLSMNRNSKTNKKPQYVAPADIKWTYNNGGIVSLLNYYPSL
jgi:hypothetical protein